MPTRKSAPVGIVYLLKRTELAVRSCAEALLTEFDLTPAQFVVLFQLKRRGSSYGLKVKGRSDQLAAGAASARLVVGGQCYAASLTCTKKGKGIRCTP